MSEGEIEVEAVTGYEVLPKEYIQELGTTKLFSTSNRSRSSVNRDSPRGNWLLTNLPQTAGATTMSRSATSP
jgi:hypothetical protein